MKKSIKFAAVSTFVALMVSAASAQTESASARTNVALIANIVLTGFKQTDGSNATPMRITNKDLLTALNATGHFTFGKNAQLILLSKDDQLPTASIRERTGATATTTDISNFLTITQPS